MMMMNTNSNNMQKMPLIQNTKSQTIGSVTAGGLPGFANGKKSIK